MPLTFEKLVLNVEAWAAERGIYKHSNARAQLLKAFSEMGELADADLKGDGTAPSIGEDLALFERLAGGTPIHASPLEHQGPAREHPRRRSRNFVGWWQFRELFEERSMA